MSRLPTLAERDLLDRIRRSDGNNVDLTLPTIFDRAAARLPLAALICGIGLGALFFAMGVIYGGVR